jgi:hypothetical protein
MLNNHPNLLGRGAFAPGGSTGVVGGPSSSTDNALVRFDGTTGKLIQNGVVTEADNTGTLTGPTDQATTSAVGSAFGNQPSNDGVEVLSSNAGDTTQTVTIIGTTTGTDTVVLETVTLTGTTFVATVKTNWGVILAVKKSATTLGTVTVRKATGDATITAGLTAAVLSVGVNTVTNTAAYARAVSMAGSGATTKTIGIQGTNTSGTVIYDSKALSGTTAVTSNSSFLTVTEIYTGDLEATRTVTLTTNGGWTLVGGSGQTLSFDSLTGSLTFAPTGTGGFLLPSGLVGSPALAFVGDTDNGIYRSGSNQWALVQNGKEAIALTGNILLRPSDVLSVTLSGATASATFEGAIIGTVQALSGAGAINVTQLHTAYTSTGVAQALTLADGTQGQIKTIVHTVDGGSGVLTPTTKIGFTTITFTNVGDSVTLRFNSTGWAIIGIFGAVAV